MTARTARRLAGVLGVVTAAFLVAHVLLSAATGTLVENGAIDVFFVVAVVGLGLVFSFSGWLIVSRQSGNTIGWLLMAIPLVFAIATATGDYATYALVTRPASVPFGRAAAWLDRWLIVPTFAAFIPLFLLFPDGRLPSRRWRPVLWLTIAAPTVTAVSFAVTPGRLTGAFANLERVRVTNPLGIDALAGTADALTQIAGIAVFLAAVLSAAAIVVRFRGSTGDLRQQIKWLAFVAVLFFAEFFALALLDPVLGEGRTGDAVGNALFALMFLTLVLGIPLACTVALLKHGLYELDIVVRKAVILGLLAAFITAVYAVIVGGIGAMVGARSNTGLSFLAAAVLAVAFAPARDRARRLADRLVYGKRATPYEVLAEFSSNVASAYATDDVLARMAQILAAGTGASEAHVWLLVGRELRPAASWPEGGAAPSPRPLEGSALPPFPGESAFEVRHRDELLGALTVRMPPSDPINPTKAKLVADLAAQAGLVVRNVRLIEELRASRQRLVAAQDQERRRLERNIHDGAQQELVALSIKLGLAEKLVRGDPERTAGLLSDLKAEAVQALENLRDLARGIYPPLLADRGLPAALESQARKSPVPATVEADSVGRYPQEVEATVFFCALEALQNVAKYAEATSVVVRLAAGEGNLSFEVADDGKGFDDSATGYGTGLQGMADRLDAVGGTLTVRSAPGQGTTVIGRVPVGTADRGLHSS
jgi:signal transduction histidine kinase